jgi:hypothetical protein
MKSGILLLLFANSRSRRQYYLRPLTNLTLDWRPLFREMKMIVLPAASGLVHTSYVKRNIKTLTKLCTFSQPYFDPRELPAMLEEFLPYFSLSFAERAFVVISLLNLLAPTSPGPPEAEWGDGRADVLGLEDEMLEKIFGLVSPRPQSFYASANIPIAGFQDSDWGRMIFRQAILGKEARIDLEYGVMTGNRSDKRSTNAIAAINGILAHAVRS